MSMKQASRRRSCGERYRSGTVLSVWGSCPARTIVPSQVAPPIEDEVTLPGELTPSLRCRMMKTFEFVLGIFNPKPKL